MVRRRLACPERRPRPPRRDPSQAARHRGCIASEPRRRAWPRAPSSCRARPDPGYRPGAAAVVRRPADGRILICERADHPGSWQFPQGGRQGGERPAETLARELEEEVALRPADYRVVRQVGPYRYAFPPGRDKEGYAGQEHEYFLVDLLAPESRINVATAHPEFRATRWIDPAGFSLGWLAPMKREPYRRVFRDLFEVELPVPAPAGLPGAA